MATRNWAVALIVIVAALLAGGAYVRAAESETATGKLAVLWTSGDPDVAHRVCFMYAHNAKKQGWFDEVRLVVWGPSQRLLAGDKDLQAVVKAMQEDGVIVEACVACAKTYGLVDTLKGLGLEVKSMGKPLTEFLKSDYEVITF
jgi:hypothetical protein